MNPSTGRRKRPELSALGQAIERARKQSRDDSGRELTQGVLAQLVSDRLKDQNRSTWQSYIARLESGSIYDPDPEILKCISRVTGVPYIELVCELIAEKYGFDKGLLFPLYLKPKLFEEMPEWEKQPEHDELWIVTREYVDGGLQRFRDAISSILERGGKCTFFLGTEAYERFQHFRARLLADFGKRESDPCLFGVQLSSDQVGLMIQTYVFANPLSTYARDTSEKTAEGYIMLSNEHGKRIVGLKMSETEIINTVDVLYKIRREAYNLRNDLQTADI